VESKLSRWSRVYAACVARSRWLAPFARDTSFPIARTLPTQTLSAATSTNLARTLFQPPCASSRLGVSKAAESQHQLHFRSSEPRGQNLSHPTSRAFYEASEGLSFSMQAADFASAVHVLRSSNLFWTTESYTLGYYRYAGLAV
jgi:hypothetical protein